eukprot:g17381.t1
MDRSIFLSKVLGHVEESEASRNYANIKARAPEIATEPQARQALDKLENKINTLEDKVAGLNANLPKDVIDALAIIKAMKDRKINISNRKIRDFARVQRGTPFFKGLSSLSLHKDQAATNTDDVKTPAPSKPSPSPSTLSTSPAPPASASSVAASPSPSPSSPPAQEISAQVDFS